MKQPIQSIAKYRCGQAVYSVKNQNYVCQIISIKARFVDGEFLTWSYELDFPSGMETQWVTENKISTKKDNNY